MRSAALFTAAVMTLVPTLAVAQDVPAVAVETSGNLDAAQLEDPNVDRGMLLPTAQTQPKGTVAFNDYELFLMGVSYGATDDLQLTATTLVPITTDMPIFLLTSAKYRLVNKGHLRVAAIGGLGVFNGELFGELGDDDGDETVFTAHAGGAASYCFTDDCHSSANFTLTGSQMFGDAGDDGVGLVYGGSIIARLTKRTKLVAEVTSGGSAGSDGLEAGDGALLSYGVRFFSSNIAGDIGFIRPLGVDTDDEDTDAFLFGIPFVTFTYRQ